MKLMRILSGILASVIATGCLLYTAPPKIISVPVLNAYAATVDDLTFTVYDDSATLTKCSTSATGAIEIPAEYEGKPVTMIAAIALDGEATTTTTTTVPQPFVDIDKDVYVTPGGSTEIHYGGYGVIWGYSIEGDENYFRILNKFRGEGFYGNPNDYYYAESVTLTCSFDTPAGDYKLKVNGAVCTIHVAALTTSSAALTTTTTTRMATTTMPRATTTVMPQTTTTTMMPLTTTRIPATTKIVTTKSANILQDGLKKFDVNKDNRVNIADAVLLTRFVSEDESAVLPLNSGPDVNADGLVTIDDVMSVLHALQPFSIQIGKATAKPGEKVTVPIKIYADKGTAAGQIYVGCGSRLTPVSVKSGDAYTMNFSADCEAYPITITWTAKDGKDQIAKNGAVLAYLEFEVDPNIKSSEYLEISIMPQAGSYATSFSDSSGITYTAGYRSGYITVIP